ncbi:MAG: hypothetical protein ABSG56_38990, partial [Bryobacteraceae bacterium]
MTKWAFTLLVLAAGAAAQTYSIQDLGTFPGGTVSQGQALNQCGQVVGYARFANFNAHAFLWTERGGLEDLGAIPPESNFSSAQAINSWGDIVGYSIYNNQGTQHAVLWTHGKLIDLGALPGGPLNQATGINDEGVVVGSSNSHAALWSQATGIVDLGALPGGNYSQALAINQRADIVGNSDCANYSGCVFVRPRNGEMQALPILPGGYDGSANAINDRGDVAGGTSSSTSDAHPVIWINGSVYDLGVLPNTGWGSAFGI